MSTIVTNTITGLSTAANITIGSTPVVSASANSLTIRGEGSAQTSIQQGLAKCWFNYDQVVPSLDDSLNMTSITDDATGKFSPTYANNFATVHYAASGMSSNTTYICLEDNIDEVTQTTTADTMMYAMKHDGTVHDNKQAMCKIHGDLA